MGLLDRILGRRRTENDTAAADERTRQAKLAGIGSIQSDDEVQATRQRMETEMSAQRERRDGPTPPEA
jgi:hypothetical protein